MARLRTSSFILAKKFYLCSFLLAGGITAQRHDPSPDVERRAPPSVSKSRCFMPAQGTGSRLLPA